MASLTLKPDGAGLVPAVISSTDANVARIAEGVLKYYGVSIAGLTAQQKIDAFVDQIKSWAVTVSSKQEEREGEEAARATAAANPTAW